MSIRPLLWNASCAISVREQQRLVQRQHQHRRADPQALGARQQRRGQQQGRRVRPVGAGQAEFAEPHAVEAEAIGRVEQSKEGARIALRRFTGPAGEVDAHQPAPCWRKRARSITPGGTPMRSNTTPKLSSSSAAWISSGAAVDGDAAVGHHHDAVEMAKSEVEVVHRHDHQPRAATGRERLDQREPVPHVERSAGLVGQQDRRVGREHGREQHARLLAARERRPAPAAEGVELVARADLVDGRPRAGRLPAWRREPHAEQLFQH
jgi:hypothetical protein